MPNWCENCLLIKGTKEQLKLFIKKNMGYPVQYPPQLKGEKRKRSKKVKYFCFNAMVRTPKKVVKIGYDGGKKVSEELMEKARKTGEDVFPIDGFNWNIANWGTKWDIDHQKITKKRITWEGDEQIHLYFSTAWNPPFRWFEKVVQAFPKLEFKMNYWEPGMYFGGVLIGKQGEATCREYSEAECENAEFFGLAE